MSAPQSESVRPVALRKEGADRLAIDWTDGHHSIYSWKHLRESCPCAGCREERLTPPNPLRVLTEAEMAPKPPLAPKEVQPVGYYAYRIIWNDGHDAGLFTLENLRELCQCDDCRKKG
jgi:DUF971 family protein